MNLILIGTNLIPTLNVNDDNKMYIQYLKSCN